MTLTRPLPETDGLANQFWSAVKDDRISIQQCLSCFQFQHYARPVCTNCGNQQLAFVNATGKGTVVSCTTIHKSPYEDIKTPYVLALVQLEEGVTLLSHLIDAKPNENYCDVSVDVSFIDFREGFKLPVFRIKGQEK